MKKIIIQLKDFSKPDKNLKDEKESKPIAVNDIVKLYPIKVLLKNIKKRGVAVTIDLNTEKRYIHMSQNRLIQVLMNIITNANDAIADGRKGAIAIKTACVMKEQPYIVISIKDNGIGIPPADRLRIFEPFYTANKDEGTGLGLSISYSIIKNYDGDIEVESEAGKGAEFKIYFPEYKMS